MTTFFISDLHLDEKHPEVIDCFIRFLNNEAKTADALYILGDLFEAWIGDDNNNPFIQKISDALKNISAQNVPIYFMQGNRDFLLGKRFAKQCGMQILKDPAVISLYEQRVLLMHGDLLCTDDLAYQNFRKKAHNKFLQKLFLLLPLSLRQKMADKARQKSQAYTQNMNRNIQDVNQQTVVNYMRDNQAMILIHGHTHRPGIHSFDLDGKLAKRYVLPAWHGQGGALACDTNGKFDYLVFSLGYIVAGTKLG